jgi:predicted Fe-Mo cluster-binding NifX family protein
MRIAVTSQNFRTVTGHAGQARRFIVFEAQQAEAPVEVARLDLDREQSIHETGAVGAHPLDGTNVVLSAGFGGHFAQVMAQRGIEAAITDREDPLEAVQDFLQRHATDTKLPIVGCSCGGECHGEDEADHHH